MYFQKKQEFFLSSLVYGMILACIGLHVRYCEGLDTELINGTNVQRNAPCCQSCRCVGTDVYCDGVALNTLPVDCPSNTTLLSLSGCGLHKLNDGELGQYYKQLQTLNISGNFIARLGRKTFAGLSELQVLNIGTNRYSVKKLDPFVFSTLPNIKYIELTSHGDQSCRSPYNAAQTVMDTFQGLANSTIETIILRNISVKPFILRKSHFKYLKNFRIKEIVLSDFFLVEIDFDVFQFLPLLEKVDLSLNSLITFDYAKLLMYLFKATKLKNITLTDNTKRKGPDVLELMTKEQAETYYQFPKSIEYIDLSNSKLAYRSYSLSYGLKLGNQVKKLDISNMELFPRIGNTILGFVHLKELYFQGNKCELSPSVFSCEEGAFESLEILNIAYNNIMLSSENETETIFTNCSRLHHLDISYNNLDHVYPKMLMDTINLRTLNLSGNNLKTLNLDLHILTSLSALNVSNNKLKTLSVDIQQDIDILNTNQSVTIDIGDNPLFCGCHSFEFIGWMQKNSKSIHRWSELRCTYYDDEMVHVHSINILTLKLSCWKNVILAGTIPSGMILTTLLVIFITYKYRYRLHYLYLQLRAALRYHGNHNLEYNFDGFISYSSLDKTWGQEALYAKLVGVYHYRICIDDVNFRPGGYISDIILDAINRSNKVILIISQNFLRSRWCAYEMNIARGELANRGRDCLILILKEPISVLPPELISPTLRSLLDTRVYLEWSEDADKKALFWRKLRDALGEPMPQEPGVDTDSPFIAAQTEEDEQRAQDYIEHTNDERPLI